MKSTMRALLGIAAATAAVSVLADATLAADVITVPVESSGIAVPIAGERFDWTGFYAGVYGIAQQSPALGNEVGAGIEAGVNAQIDFFLVGGEVALHGLTGDAVETAYGQVLGRGGVVLADNLLVYAAAGYGLDLGGSTLGGNVLAGGGLEYAVTDDLSLRAQYLRGFAGDSDTDSDQFSIGANFHF